MRKLNDPIERWEWEGGAVIADSKDPHEERRHPDRPDARGRREGSAVELEPPAGCAAARPTPDGQSSGAAPIDS